MELLRPMPSKAVVWLLDAWRDGRIISFFLRNFLFWQNKAKFDESENPTRGLEEFLDTKRRRATLRKNHREAVLQEMVRQKTGGSKKLDWEKIRSAAEPYSKETAQIAYEIAMEDAGKPVSKSKSSSKSSGGKTKKKGGLFGIFKKKWWGIIIIPNF